MPVGIITRLGDNLARIGNLIAQGNAVVKNETIDATILDSNLNPQTVNQAVVTPQTRTSFTPRLDYTINSSNTHWSRCKTPRADTLSPPNWSPEKTSVPAL